MSGPALKKWDSHSSIHEAALTEAKELTEILRQYVNSQEQENALKVAYIALEHWETRTLIHAQEEEEGLYQEALRLNPDYALIVQDLTRDHTIMRKLARDIKRMLAKGETTAELVQRFQALILVDELHNEDEERFVTGAFPHNHLPIGDDLSWNCKSG
ncbi:MAG TPA: hemerythrin domain-containing protein [Bacilli bacterium]